MWAGFQSTLPMRGATPAGFNIPPSQLFQSTLPMRGATDGFRSILAIVDISIHAPHAGSDVRRAEAPTHYRYFNPRSPCGERLGRCAGSQSPRDFNPRSPCGERQRAQTSHCPAGNFNPRSPCGERPGIPFYVGAMAISIHAPHAGSDPGLPPGCAFLPGFQSTLPMRGATAVNRCPQLMVFISIHAPHAGSDTIDPDTPFTAEISIHAPHAGSDLHGHFPDHVDDDFNPRSPCGERRGSPGYLVRDYNFNPRSPCGERQLNNAMRDLHTQISIHAPHAGSDTPTPSWESGTPYFNPRSPCGERQSPALWMTPQPGFQSTLPMRGATPLSTPSL